MKNSPAAITVITRDELEAFGIVRLEDLFRVVPGFEALDANWGEHVLHQGLPSTLLFMLDGVPLYDAMNGFRTLSRDFRLMLEHIERIEIVRGPSSVLSGPNAFLGVVNFITRECQRETPTVRARVRGGTQETVSAAVSADQRRRALRYAVSLDYHQTRGPVTHLPDSPWATLFVPTATWGNGGQTQNGVDRYYQASARVEVLERLELIAHYLRSDVQYEISQLGSLMDPEHPGFWNKEHAVFAARFLDQLLDGQLSYRLGVSHFQHLSNEPRSGREVMLTLRWEGNLRRGGP